MMLRNLVLTGLMVSLQVPTLVVAASSTLKVNSSAIADGATIPTQFTCSGANQSPPLAFDGVPEGTKTLVLLMEDPDAPGGTFVHWVVYDISPGSTGFKAGSAEGKPGANSMGRAAYMGPCPPPGNPHHYHFRLFALDWKPAFDTTPTGPAVRGAMTGHIIQSAELVGIFGR